MIKLILTIASMFLASLTYASTIECVEIEEESRHTLDLRKINGFANCFELALLPANKNVYFTTSSMSGV